MKTSVPAILLLCCASLFAAYHADFPFAKYPAGDIYRGKPAPAHPDSPSAVRFRTVIENGARKGPNFAGHYTVVTWGCGAACASFAIVDAQDGKVWQPPYPTVGFQDAEGFFQHTGLYYQVNSSLFVLQGCPDGKDCAEHYYRWTGDDLEAIESKPLAHIKPAEPKPAQ